MRNSFAIRSGLTDLRQMIEMKRCSNRVLPHGPGDLVAIKARTRPASEFRRGKRLPT